MPLRGESDPEPTPAARESQPSPKPESAAPPSRSRSEHPDGRKEQHVSTNAMTAPERENLTARNRSQEEKEKPGPPLNRHWSKSTASKPASGRLSGSWARLWQCSKPPKRSKEHQPRKSKCSGRSSGKSKASKSDRRRATRRTRHAKHAVCAWFYASKESMDQNDKDWIAKVVCYGLDASVAYYVLIWLLPYLALGFCPVYLWIPAPGIAITGGIADKCGVTRLSPIFSLAKGDHQQDNNHNGLFSILTREGVSDQS